MLAIDVAVMFVSLIFAVGVSTQWDTYLRFRYGGSFGVADPLFGVDLGFYFFRLPFYELLQGSLTFLTVAALAILGFVAFLGMRQSKPGKNSRWATIQLGIWSCFSSFWLPISGGAFIWITTSLSIRPSALSTEPAMQRRM